MEQAILTREREEVRGREGDLDSQCPICGGRVAAFFDTAFHYRTGIKRWSPLMCRNCRERTQVEGRR